MRSCLSVVGCCALAVFSLKVWKKLKAKPCSQSLRYNLAEAGALAGKGGESGQVFEKDGARKS